MHCQIDSGAFVNFFSVQILRKMFSTLLKSLEISRKNSNRKLLKRSELLSPFFKSFIYFKGLDITKFWAILL